MSDIEEVPTIREVTIGDVFSTTVDVVFKNILPLFALAGLFYLPTLIFQYYNQPDFADPLNIDYFASGMGGILGLLFQFALIAAMTSAVFAALQGNKVGIGPSITQGLARMFPVLGVSILTGLAIMVGFVFLIIPGIIVSIMLCLSVPAVVVERGGVFAAMSRSSELTSGYRWKIFGLYLVALVVLLIIATIFGAVVSLVGFGLNGNMLALLITGWVVDVVIGVFSAALTAVLYFKLRMAKEGLDLGQIASVFE